MSRISTVSKRSISLEPNTSKNLPPLSFKRYARVCPSIIGRVWSTEVLPLKYNVWKFYGKNYSSVVVEDNGVRYHYSLQDMSIVRAPQRMAYARDDDDYGTHYGEFAGSYAQDVMGYSDDVINDAFEGDPEAYWNID